MILTLLQPNGITFAVMFEIKGTIIQQERGMCVLF